MKNTIDGYPNVGEILDMAEDINSRKRRDLREMRISKGKPPKINGKTNVRGF